jgi:transcriptional regulator with XRE-family HTH domain
VVNEVREVLEKRGEDLGAFIRKQREQAKLSLSNPYLSQIERGLRNPSAEILQAIAKALDLSAETLYVRAGILDERSEGDVESAIARDAQLTENQRATLIEMYRTFRSMGNPEGAGTAPAAGSQGTGAKGAPGTGKVVGRVIDAVTTGEVTDADIAATTLEGEDPTEA